LIVLSNEPSEQKGYFLACGMRSFGRAKGDEEGGFMIGTDKRLGIKHIQVVETKSLISF
jgi:hypothetical protein